MEEEVMVEEPTNEAVVEETTEVLDLGVEFPEDEIIEEDNEGE